MCVGRTIAICCRSLLLLLLLTGMIMSIMAVSSCNFMKAVYEVPNNILGGNNSTSETITMDAPLGLWRYETSEGCKAYKENNIGGTNVFQNERQEIVAQKSGVAAACLALVAILLLLLELCCCGRGKCGGCGGIPCLKFVLALLFTATEICQGLTFLFMNSQQFCHDNAGTAILKHHCEISKGGALSAGALVLFVLCSALLSCTPALNSGSAADANKDGKEADRAVTPTTTNITNKSDDFDDVSFDDEASPSNMQGTLA